jgi:hypothetical protein
VNISYPFVCETENDAKKHYEELTHSKVKGLWEVVHMLEPAFYYFKFSETLNAASNSAITDFKFIMESVDTAFKTGMIILCCA